MKALDPSCVEGRLRWLIVGALFIASCATSVPTPVTSVKELAGQWDGWIANGLGGFRRVTVIVREDGTYDMRAVDGGAVRGQIVLSGRALGWRDISAEGRPLKVIERHGGRVLKGTRADGTLQFEWTKRP